MQVTQPVQVPSEHHGDLLQEEEEEAAGAALAEESTDTSDMASHS